MPWVRKGNRIYRQRADGSAGELVQTCGSVENAKAALRIRWASVENEKTKPARKKRKSSGLDQWIDAIYTAKTAKARDAAKRRLRQAGKAQRRVLEAGTR